MHGFLDSFFLFYTDSLIRFKIDTFSTEILRNWKPSNYKAIINFQDFLRIMYP